MSYCVVLLCDLLYSVLCSNVVRPVVWCIVQYCCVSNCVVFCVILLCVLLCSVVFCLILLCVLLCSINCSEYSLVRSTGYFIKNRGAQNARTLCTLSTDENVKILL